MMNVRPKTVLFVSALLMLQLACTNEPAASTDRADVAALYEQYRQAWLLNDPGVPEAVISLFAEDASLMPHQGDPIVSGRDAIAEHWFPGGEMFGTVDIFEQQVLKTERSGGLAYVYGRFELAFTYDGKTTHNEGSQLMVARLENGVWKIVALIWTDRPA